MSLIFERYLDEKQPRKADTTEELAKSVELGERARKQLLGKADASPIKPVDTIGVWL